MDAYTTFLVAFNSTTPAFISASVASPSSKQAKQTLQTLFLNAITECENSLDVRRFLCQCRGQLDQCGKFERDSAEKRKWQWLVDELMLFVELDTKCVDESVRIIIQQFANRITLHNDTNVSILIDIQNDTAVDTKGTEHMKSNVAGKHASPQCTTSSDVNSDPNSPQSLQDKTVLKLQHRSSSVGSVLRSVSSLLGFSTEETFLCQICFEHQLFNESVQLSACGHRFCLDCFQSYLEHKINEGQIYPVCFHRTDESHTSGSIDKPHACGIAITPNDVESIVTSNTWNKYLMFKFNKENERGRQCPYCSYSQVCAGPEHPVCVCEQCHKTYCFLHGNAHVNSSCADYELLESEADKMNRLAIAEFSKPCPGCQNSVEKSGGCNHMKCVVCQTDFCWICGAIVDDSPLPEHFQWWNVRGCPGLQMEDVDAQSRSQRVLSRVFRILLLVLLGPLTVAITLVLTVLSCFCVPCMKLFDKTFYDMFTGTLTWVWNGFLLLMIGICLLILALLLVIVELLVRILCCGQSLLASNTENPEQVGVEDITGEAYSSDLEAGKG